MAATRIDQLRQPASERLLEASRYPDRGNTVMPSMAHEHARIVVRDVLVTTLPPEDVVAVELTVYFVRGDPQTFLIPDVLVTLGAGAMDPATGRLRKAYRVWDDGPPDLVIELASPSTVQRDNLGKKEDYAAFGIREYVQFDPLDPTDPEWPLLDPTLQVWRLVAGSYVAVEAGPDGGVPSAVLTGLEWVQAGQFLRLRDARSGALLPTAAEKEAAGRRRAEQAAAEEAAARRRAEQAAAEEAAVRRRAEEAAVTEAARAEAEIMARQRAEAHAAAEAARADTAATRADAADAELARLRAEIARLHGERT